MAYNFSNLKDRIKEVQDWLSKELSQVRTGRATPAILDSVRVDAYGSEMPIQNVASVSSEDARTLRIVPWDTSMIKAIEKAITVANLGLSVAVDDKGVRVSFPLLTTETRGQFVKIANQKVEEAKVALRQDRNKTNDDLESKKKSGEMSEDDLARNKSEVDKLIKEAGEGFDALGDKKEKEIMET